MTTGPWRTTQKKHLYRGGGDQSRRHFRHGSRHPKQLLRAERVISSVRLAYLETRRNGSQRRVAIRLAEPESCALLLHMNHTWSIERARLLSPLTDVPLCCWQVEAADSGSHMSQAVCL